MTATRYQQSLSISNARAREARCEIAADAPHRRDARNAAGVAPDAVAATLDDDALDLRRDRRRRRTASRTGCAALGSGAATGCCGGATRRSRRCPVFAALAKIGAVFAPLNARASVDEVAPVAEYARPRLLLARRVARRAGAELAARRRHPVRRRTIPIGAERPRPPTPARRARSARHLLHEREHRAGPKGVVLSHRANWLRTYRRRDHDRGRRRAPCACSRCSTWRAGRSRSARGRAGGRCTSCGSPTPRRCCATTARHRAARLYCIPAVWARILEHGVGALRPVGAGRSRHRHVGDAARAARTRSRTRCRTP